MMTRRDLFGWLYGLGFLFYRPTQAFAQNRLPTRTIPASGETLPVIGLGSSKAVSRIPADGTDSLAEVLRMLVNYGGQLVDTTPYSEENEGPFGQILSAPDLRDELFVALKINTMDEQIGIRQVRQAQRLFDRETFDLIQVMSLRGLDVHWPNVKEWKETGEARYIGATVSNYEDYGDLESFMNTESLDFIQVNYSIIETLAEERILPLAQDLGIAVIINGPFMNGDYFGLVNGQTLPEWAMEFDCASWAQFSLKYILAHPAVTSVLTETTNPQHMQENIASAFGRLPNESEKQRMNILARSL